MPLPELSSIHDAYLLLSRLTRDRFDGALGGKLLLRLGFDAAGIAAVVATSVAGGAALCVDGDAEVLRAGLRSGLCDFVVGDLDEALRILKNEVRRRLPVSVCLTADPAACVAAMIERGVQPDVLSARETKPGGAFSVLLERGAVVLRGDEALWTGPSLLCWGVAKDAPRLMPQIGRIAAASLDDQHADTPARRRWLELAPRYLGRSFGMWQCVRMTEAEAAAFVSAARSEAPSAEITIDGKAV